MNNSCFYVTTIFMHIKGIWIECMHIIKNFKCFFCISSSRWLNISSSTQNIKDCIVVCCAYGFWHWILMCVQKWINKYIYILLFQLGLGGLAVLTYGELTNKIYMYRCFSIWMFAGFFVIFSFTNSAHDKFQMYFYTQILKSQRLI